MIEKVVGRESLAKSYSGYSYEKLIESNVRPNHWIFKLLRNGVVPTRNEVAEEIAFSTWSSTNFYIRDVYIHTFGFPLITHEVVKELAEYLKGKKVLELAGGSGYLSSLLQKEGIKIRVTDSFDWANGKMGSWRKSFTKVEKMDAFNAIEIYGEESDIVLLSWPPYSDPLAYDILVKCIEKRLPMIYIGEDYGGCTGDDRFFELIEAECEIKQIVDSYAPFSSIHDFIYEIKRKEN